MNHKKKKNEKRIIQILKKKKKRFEIKKKMGKKKITECVRTLLIAGVLEVDKEVDGAAAVATLEAKPGEEETRINLVNCLIFS